MLRQSFFRLSSCFQIPEIRDLMGIHTLGYIRLALRRAAVRSSIIYNVYTCRRQRIVTYINVEELTGESMNQVTFGVGGRLGQSARRFLLRVVAPAVLGLAVALVADAQAANAALGIGCHKYCNGAACISTPHPDASCEAGWWSGCTTNGC